MRWYKRIFTASKPPSYVLERVSDLSHAAEVSKTSPSNAKSLINEVVSQLEAQADQEYVDELMAACDIMLDSPSRARALVEVVTGNMMMDKQYGDSDKEMPWLANLRK